MKIKSIRYWKEDLELTRPYTITYIVHEKVENLFVQVICEEGIYGLGSGSPSQYVTGEILDTDFNQRQDELSAFLVGRDLRSFNFIIEELTGRLPKNPAILAALDMALHDAFCKYIDIPLLKFYGQKIQPMPTSITIGISSIEDTLEDGTEYLEKGFQIIKLKIGQSLEKDIERFIKLRELVKNKMRIRVDANQGFTPAELMKFINATKKYDLEFFEQPFVPGKLDWMRELPEEVRSNCAADEDMHKLTDALKLNRGDLTFGIFNIKLMKCGGITEAKKIAEVARITKKSLMWGCMDESVISISAGLNAALSCPATKYLDLDGSFDLAKDVASGGFVLDKGILYPMADKAGLGVELIH